MSKKITLLLVGIVALIIVAIILTSPATKNTTSVENVEEYLLSNDEGSVAILTYGDSAETATLETDGELYQLRRVVSASGARYANEDETVIYWEHQGEATLEIDGELVATITSIVPAEEQEGVGTETPILDEPAEPTLPITTIQSNPSQQALLANAWEWQETIYNNDTVVTPSDSSRFTAQFSEDGTFSSTTDCNNTFGGYSLGKDSSLSFGPLASTLMACMESQEMEYGEMLSQITSYMIADNGNLVLMLKYDSGSMIFTPQASSEANN